MSVGIDPKVDYAFKWLFGREGSSAVFIDLLQAVLNPSPGERIAGVELLNPFSEKAAPDDKLWILDIKARDQSGRQFNVEMQMLAFAALRQRTLFYWSKLYVEQIQQGDDYALLRPTISVCFLDDLLFPNVSDYHTCFRLVERNHGVVFTDHLQVHFLELPKFGKPASELSTALDGWLYFLRRAEELDPAELPRSLDKPEIRQALEALTMLAHTDMQREVYEGRLKAIRDERARMVDAESRGLEKGLEKGREEGALIGRIQLLEQLLGQQETPGDALVSRTTEELQRMVDELRQRLGR